MASVLKVDKLDPQSGTALEIGTSGDTITVPSGATFAVSGTMNASSITAGTVATARLGSGTASSSTVLYGDQTYKAEPGGTNVASFQATISSDQTGISDATWTKVAFDQETFDPDSVFDTSNNRFIAPSAGTYLLLYKVRNSGSANYASSSKARFYLNGGASAVSYTSIGFNSAIIAEDSITGYSLMSLSTSDYVEVYINLNVSSGDVTVNSAQAIFSGFKLII